MNMKINKQRISHKQFLLQFPERYNYVSLQPELAALSSSNFLLLKVFLDIGIEEAKSVSFSFTMSMHDHILYLLQLLFFAICEL